MITSNCLHSGLEAGRNWASKASSDQIERIVQLTDSPDFDTFFEPGAGAFGPAERLFAILRPESVMLRVESREFWQSECDSREWQDADFVRGFVDGVLA